MLIALENIDQKPVGTRTHPQLLPRNALRLVSSHLENILANLISALFMGSRVIYDNIT